MGHKTKAATILALVMHLAGLVGIYYGMHQVFEKLTPFNLVVMLLLTLYTLPEKNGRVLIFFLIASAVGLATEMAGIQTGVLFGNYTYGTSMGLKLNGVPVLIGINWFIVVYASGMLAIQLRALLGRYFLPSGRAAFSRWFGLSVVIDGALIATLFDWIMEPAAVKLGFWKWDGGHIPLLNYLTWFLISLLLLTFFKFFKLKYHPFAVNLLLIQVMFFAIISLI